MDDSNLGNQLLLFGVSAEATPAWLLAAVSYMETDTGLLPVKTRQEPA
jgi:hypothetical protein